MLSFNLMVGDDVYLGREDTPRDQWVQLIVNRIDGNTLTLLSPTEAIDLDLRATRVKVPLGHFDTDLMARWHSRESQEVTLGFDAPREVTILRGKVFRRTLSE